VDIIAPYAHWDIPAIGQSYILFRAKLAPPYTISCGPESLDVQWFDPDEIPFEQLAFSSVHLTLK
jgi:ADP-ribose/FAD diphosphatase